ncbi:Rap1a/Tai family immunity protein [Achromobacter insuavis]|uniref:Rap1a/Tai family immunity protein n=1 Tax=Achromobacter insuavis TaxID=1287735 RepID=UPI001FD784CC|nr:Rap1a/Tai family immunity protein [Achromobacter insuavis]
MAHWRTQGLPRAPSGSPSQTGKAGTPPTSSARRVEEWPAFRADAVVCVDVFRRQERLLLATPRPVGPQAYVAGVADQTRGAVWCTPTGVLPHELKDTVYRYLTKLPASRLEENAGPLVSEALHQSFACR